MKIAEHVVDGSCKIHPKYLRIPRCGSRTTAEATFLVIFPTRANGARMAERNRMKIGVGGATWVSKRFRKFRNILRGHS
jgi:hypothetical protein